MKEKQEISNKTTNKRIKQDLIPDFATWSCVGRKKGNSTFITIYCTLKLKKYLNKEIKTVSCKERVYVMVWMDKK